MSTLTIPRDRLFDELREGDRITAIDGDTLPEPRQVAVVRVRPNQLDRYDAVGLVNPLNSGVEWNLYPDAQVERDVTVERADPARPVEQTARQTRQVKLHTPRTELLRSKRRSAARRQNANGGWYDDIRTYSPEVRKLLRRKDHYVTVLRMAADRPGGLLHLNGIPDRERRSIGTMLGYAAKYGWAYQVDTSPAVWQLTQTGLNVILAWDAEQEGSADQ
jgi:hypothetical protein